jgi:hypothetical protein
MGAMNRAPTGSACKMLFMPDSKHGWKLFLVLALSIVPAFSIAETKNIPGEFRNFLFKQIHLNETDLARIQTGESIIEELPTERREEIALFGIVHMDISPDFFLSHFRQTLTFESGHGVVQNGVFSTPPSVSDLSGLRWEVDDLEKIRDCNPASCTARLPGGNVSQFHKGVNWSSPQAMAQANDLMRRLSVSYVTQYQSQGDDALTSYLKDGRLLSVKEGTRELLQNSLYLFHYVPELVSYLQNYPREKRDNVENIFYWQRAEFGLQPVIRFNHVAIFKDVSNQNYVIASKMLYANHYFRDGVEIQSLVSDQENGSSKGFYLVVLSRSHVDGMTGFKGHFLRKKVVNKTKEALQKWLMKTKRRMEN